MARSLDVFDVCRCNDDNAEIFFDNGAIAHYYFASTDKHKSIADALEVHGGSPFSYYDAVFANIGNYPHMRMESVLTVAEELQAEGVREGVEAGDGEREREIRERQQ